MVGSFLRFAVAATFSCSLAACATPDYDYTPPAKHRVAAVTPHTGVSDPSKPLQCVPYARARTGVNIFGDAYTWWDRSSGKYEHREKPQKNAVMMLTGYAGPNRAHLAVVSSIVSSREIRIDHANWFNDGAVYRDDPVRDVSPDNDWTMVRVYNIRSQSWGTRTYLVRGFIGPDAASGRDDDDRNVRRDHDDNGGDSDLLSIN
jgi:surface antigen